MPEDGDRKSPRSGRVPEQGQGGQAPQASGSRWWPSWSVARLTGLSGYISLDGLDRLRAWIVSFGVVAPIVFVAIYAVATVAFLPGTPLSLLAGLVFGPVFGALWAVIGATIGATLSFPGRKVRGAGPGRGLDGEQRRASGGWTRASSGTAGGCCSSPGSCRSSPSTCRTTRTGSPGSGSAPTSRLTAVCIIPGAAVYTFAGGSLASARQDLTQDVRLPRGRGRAPRRGLPGPGLIRRRSGE